MIGLQRFVGIDHANDEHPFWSTLTRWAGRSTFADTAELVEDERTRPYFNGAAFSAEDRLHWMDSAGIDRQVLNPTTAIQMIAGAEEYDPSLAAKIRRSYNSWAEDMTQSSDRLLPAGLLHIDADDATTVHDLELIAASGAATFVTEIDRDQWARLTQPDASLFWSAAEAFGVQPTIHLGVVGPSHEPLPNAYAEWAARQLEAQRCLLQWVSSRHAWAHPQIRMLVAELGVDWAPSWLANVRRSCDTPVLNELVGEAQPNYEIIDVAENRVVWVPLPRDNARVHQMLVSIPLAFGSDYPHHEGWGDDPVASFADAVDAADSALTGQHWYAPGLRQLVR